MTNTYLTNCSPKLPTKVEGGGSFKTVKCSVCDKTFSRTDHLKRHQLRHSGIKPYSCIFCKDSFTRSDNLREHYPACPERGLREIPDGGRRGRRPHACDSESIMIPILAPSLTSSQCTSVKLGCDGNNPCRTCRAKRIECRYSRLQQQNIAVKRDEVPRPVIDNPQSSDIGSIKFLLNHGTASFIECFSFPPNSERRNTLESSDFSTQDSESINLNHFRNGSDNGSNFSDPFEEDSIDLSVFDDENLLRFLNGPFNNIQTETDDVFASLFMDPTFVTFDSMPDLSINPPLEWEPATVQSGAMMQAILDKAYAMRLHAKELSDISDNLSFLFLPSRIERLVKLYFETWHRHCPILHQPSFQIDTAPIPLLISVTLLGAMYSQIEREACVAKALLDISELYVYSMEDLTGESEIRHMLRAGNSDDSSMMGLSHLAFLHLQGAYLMICAQFWGGNRLARKRAMEMRFGVVVKLARKLGLTKEKHDLQDSINEYSWIQKEARIRTINIMTLIDCAFSFFANFPCRLALSEMHFDLPCDEDIFASPHPFSETDFHPTRRLGLLEAFQSLFGKTKSARHLKTDLTNGKNNPLGLNVMDMFILIHLLYVYTQVQLTLFSSSLSRSATTSSFELNITQTKSALVRWRNLWNIVRSKTSPHTWARLGFFKNAYNYWLVTQLLINNKNSLEIMMGMEVNCEDTLTHLRSLLREPGTET